MVDNGVSGVMVGFKEFATSTRSKRLLDKLSGDKSGVQVLEGLVGLSAEMGEFMVEGCL